MALSRPERQLLLGLARRALSYAAAANAKGMSVVQTVGRAVRELAPEPSSLPLPLTQPGGVFVSLHKRGELRGCVGVVEARQPLYLALMDAAISAALHDPRFSPVRADEVAEIDIEISALSTPQKLEPPISPELITPGEHGIIVTQGLQRGLLLPQVAAERGWTAERLLEETCRKAGLPRDAWRTGAHVERFQAEVFGEKEQPGD